MATRIDREVGKTQLPFFSDLLQNHLIRRAGRNPSQVGLFGLKRANALSDVDSPSESLTTVLNSISQVADAAEVGRYGKFSPQDWLITNELESSEITRNSISRLRDVSKIEGASVSVSPRLRVADRLGFLDSIYGRGSWPGLAAGPTAFFYRISPALRQEVGFIKFTYNPVTLSVSIVELLGPDGSTPLTTETVLGQEAKVVVDIVSYINPTTSEEIGLRGLDISLSAESGGVWKLYSGTSAVALGDLGNTNSFLFKITRPYSFVNLPKWYTESPNNSSKNIPGSADDTSPETSFTILKYADGEFFPVEQKEYWYSGAYIEYRWSFDERASIPGYTSGTNVTQDSNMEFLVPPFPLRFEKNNWGVRWDGYLRLDRVAGGPHQFVFQVQTNSAIKIDLAIEKNIDDEAVWVNVIDTEGNSARETEVSDKYFSSESFTISNVSTSLINYTNNSFTEWEAYIPISIRLFNGGEDKAYDSSTLPARPNFFIKTLQKTTTSPEAFYGLTTNIELVGTDGNWTITGGGQQLIDILEDVTASVGIQLVAKENSGGQLQVISPTTISLTTDGTSVTSTTTGLEATGYTLRISPNLTNFGSSQALWKSRIISPAPTHNSYTDLTDGSFQPIISKQPFDIKPLWWKVLQGGEFNRALTPSLDNNPLEGLISNVFKPVLESNAPGVGLYGNGLGTYSNVPNVILGEARFQVTEPLSSNYIGTRLFPNLLGEGGVVRITALPVNSATFSSSLLLGANDLGGTPNHLTTAVTESEIVRLYWSDVYNGEKFYLHPNLALVSASDDPETVGLPAFYLAGGAVNPVWLSPISVIATELADNLEFTTNRREFIAPLSLDIEKVEIAPGIEVLGFTTNFPPLLSGGDDFVSFNAKYVRYYTNPNLPFQFSRVDGGEGASFADTLKLTYDSGVFNPALSEVPRPPADRVTPFGYDNPTAYTNGICYPPYAINDSLLEQLAISDADLLTQPAGNYNVFWGEPTQVGLGGNKLKLTEKLEFSITSSVPQSQVIEPISSVALQSADYTHRLEVNLPLPPSYDEDVLYHIGSGEGVADKYFLFAR